MAFIQVEASVRTHRKFLQAGPAASWLWLCGVGYCQDGLTDGFIPFEALPYLGVKAPDRLKCKLVDAGLWVEVPGGWRIHDYLSHNKSATQIQALKNHKRGAGKAGGIASGEARREAAASPAASTPAEAPSEARGEPISSRLISSHLISSQLVSSQVDFPGDVWFRELKAAYPQSAVSDGHLTQSAFIDAVLSKGTPAATFTVMLANLDSQKQGHQWREKKMIPRLDRWLREGLWQQQHEPDAPSLPSSSKLPTWAQNKAQA